MSSPRAASAPCQEVDNFFGMIGPKNLVSLVRNTADFIFPEFKNLETEPVPRLITLGAGERDYAKILSFAARWEVPPACTSEALEDYFAICIAAHHATVATFVPTDVDSKIRGGLWERSSSRDSRRAMFDLARRWLGWDIAKISTRADSRSGVGPVSGHNGEQLGVLAGALGAFIQNGELDDAEEAAQVIDDELAREAHEFNCVAKQRGEEVTLLRLASSLTHNTGDLNQGINYWQETSAHEPYRVRFGRLSHENRGVYGRAYEVAAALYRAMMSPEGHRHYPLREVPALRRSPELLLPLAPFLDDWGAKVATSRSLTDEERAAVLAALLNGCRKIPGQVGYFRAIAGFSEALGGRLSEISRMLPAQARNYFKDADLRRAISIRKESYESTMRKRATEVLKNLGLRG